MQREKMRYGLIIAIIALISFLIFMLTSLALGLRHQNSAAIRSWDATSIALSAQADDQLPASLLTQAEVAAYQAQDSAAAVMGYSLTPIQAAHVESQNLPFLGIEPDSFLAQQLHLTAGTMFAQPDQVLLAADFAAAQDIAVGDTIELGADHATYTVSGLVADAYLSVSPVIYGDFSEWSVLRDLPAAAGASAVVAQQELQANSDAALENTSVLAIGDFIQELPGYAAQNATFSAMILTLAVVTFVVIAVFLYILVLQKLPNIAVLRAQGVPAGFLIRSVLLQAVLMTFCGLVLAAVAMALVLLVVPSGIPTFVSLPLLAAVALALLLMAVLGALIPARQIARVDPLTLIG